MLKKMSRWKKINLVCFLITVLCSASLIYVLGTMNLTAPFGKPWHLLPSIHEDSLSSTYVNRYHVLDYKPIMKNFFDSTRTNVYILVDAWGVPAQEDSLEKDFSIFASQPHKFALHQRLANRTNHAEKVEFRNTVKESVYLFGGDSLEYNRSVYIKEIGFDKITFCNKCSDSVMLLRIDSLIKNDSLQLIAWTTQSSRLGEKDSLNKALVMIANFAKSHPDVHIVVQGSHRPILGSARTRKSYKSHWVPIVFLNEVH